jgi:hypothetical protein
VKPIVTQAPSFEAAIADAVCVQRVLGGHGWTGMYGTKPDSSRDADIQTVPPG